MLEARERQPEVIEPMTQGSTGDRDAEPARVGEVRQAEPAGRVLLAEDDVPLGAVHGAPGMDPPFERAADVGVQLQMAAPQLVEHADRPDAGRGLQDRHDLGLPIGLQGVGPSSAPRCRLLRGQARIGLGTVAGGGREPGFRRGSLDGQCLSVAHEQPRLMVADVEAGQIVDPSLFETDRQLHPTPADRQTRLQNAPPAGLGLRSGYALPSSQPRRRFLILIDAEFSP